MLTTVQESPHVFVWFLRGESGAERIDPAFDCVGQRLLLPYPAQLLLTADCLWSRVQHLSRAPLYELLDMGTVIA